MYCGVPSLDGSMLVYIFTGVLYGIRSKPCNKRSNNTKPNIKALSIHSS